MTVERFGIDNPKEIWVLWPNDYKDPDKAGLATRGDKQMTLAEFERYRQKRPVWAVVVDW